MNSQPIGSYHTAQDDEISLGEIWQALKLRAWLIVIATFLFAAVAAGVALSMTSIYRAEIVLSVVDDSNKGSSLGGLASQFGGLASFAGVNLAGGSSARSEALGTLGSRQLVDEYITTHELLPVLFSKKWDASRGDWKTGIEKTPTLWDATQLFTEDVRKVSDDKKGGLVTLTIEWKDAAMAAQWANELVQLANKTLREKAIKRSEGNLAYLNAQLEKTSVVELRQAIFRLIESEVKNVMVAQGSDDFAFKTIDPAVTPEKKIKPKRSLIVVVGAFLGLILSSFYALLTARKP